MFYLNIKNLQEFVNLRKNHIMNMVTQIRLGWCFYLSLAILPLALSCLGRHWWGWYGFRYYHYSNRHDWTPWACQARPETLVQPGHH